MSGLSGHLLPQSKTSSIQGTIHTENPELLKLLQEVSPDNQANKQPSPRKFPADIDRKEANRNVLDLHRKSPDTEHSKNIKNLLNNQKKVITKSDHQRRITDSGDGKGNSSHREGKENYYLTDNSDDVEEIDNENISDSSIGENAGIINDDCKERVHDSYKGYLQEKVNLSAETAGNRSLGRKRNLIVEDPSSLSDITESDCETVGSTSSELARLRTPSRSSLNVDFEDSSLPSSPVHRLQAKSDKDNRNSRSESDRKRGEASSTSVSDRDSATPADNIIRAGGTPFYSSQRHQSLTPSVREAQDNSDCSNTPELITPVAIPAQTLLKENTQKHKPQNNVTHKSASGTTAFCEGSLSSTNRYRTEELASSNLPAITSEITGSASPLATILPTSHATSGQEQGPRSDRLHPAYGELSPQLSPRSSQTAAISSRLQKLTKDTSLHPQDTLTPRANISYLSQRLKSRGDTGKRSASVSTVKDSLDSQILDIEKDSLEITQNNDKKDNSRNQNQEKVKGQSSQYSESSLKDSLTEPTRENNRSNNTWVFAKTSDNRKKENNTVTIDSNRTPVSIVDLQKKISLPEKGQHKPTIQHGARNAPGVNKQEQGFVGSLSSLQATEQEEFEHREFVLRTNPNKQVASRNYPAEGSSQNVHHTADPVQTAGSVRSSNRTTPSVKKVYIDSPVFTKEEEKVYRFVTSRVGDSQEEVMETYRELDMAALDNQEKYAARFGGQKRVRYMDVDERYEDTDDQSLGGEVGDQFPLANAQAHPVEQLRQVAPREHNTHFGEEQADKENQFDRYETDPGSRRSNQQQAYKHHPASPQDQRHAGVLRQGKPSHGSSNPQNQIFSNQQDYPVNSNQRKNLNQLQGFTNNPQVAYNQLLGLGNNPGAQFSPHEVLPHQQGHITQHGIFANQSGFNQQGLGQNKFQHPQLLQRQPPNNISQQPSNHDQQQRNKQEQPQENNTPPVRGLSLPTGPTYDPADEEDLKRETTYQHGLRLRIEDRHKRAQQTTIPELPVNADRIQHQFDSQDYVEDSLDDDPNDEIAQSLGGGFVNDSLNVHTMQYQQQQYPQQTANPFRNPPPPLPQNFAAISASNSNFPGYRSSRLDNVNFESEDYADHVDIRQQRVNPQIRPRFYNPQFDHQQGYANSEEYFDEESSTDRGVANVAYDVSQRYEDRGEDGVDEQPMEAVQPQPPKYDYIKNNKEDLGKHVPKSYIKIHETTLEEKERLQETFIQPKRKAKGGFVRKQGQDQGQQRAPVVRHQPENDEYATTAEQVWAQRSATLAKKVDGGGNRGRRKGPGGLQKFNSDSSLSQTSIPHRRQSFQQQQHQQLLQRPQQQKQPPPDTRAFMTEMPTPLSGASVHSQPVQHHNIVPQQQTEVTVQPMTQRQTEVNVQPVTQHLLTQDGQRISVDVNLKLISPPSLGEGPQHYQYQQQPQQYPPPQHPQPYYPQPQYPQPPYPHPQYPQPQYYGGHGRQYPAVVSNYDDSGGENARNGIPALEYPLQEFYDSDSNDYRHGSPRERYSADEALRLLNESRTEMNPYGKIPPIGRSQGGDHPSSAPAPDQTGSYMEMYMKQKVKDTEGPWYKVYGLKDYRRMQKEVRLGTLGPDLDSDAAKERREKMTRQQDYAKTVMQKNRSELSHRKPPTFPRPKEDNDILTRRKLAIEYAKSVPKPTVRVQPNEFNNYELASEKSPIAKHHRRETAADGQQHTSPRQPHKKDREMDILDLDKLRQRYEEDKMNEAIIRRNTHSLNKESYY